jgi:hypothetical protein
VNERMKRYDQHEDFGEDQQWPHSIKSLAPPSIRL